MSKEVFAITAQSKTAPVQAIKTHAPMEHEQRWRCAVCGQQMGYSQPISLELALALLAPFLDYHRAKCGKEVTDEPASQPAL